MMKELFIEILNLSLSAAYLVPVVLVLRLVLKKAPRWTMCLLWGLVALRLVMPFSLESDVSLHPGREPVTELQNQFAGETARPETPPVEMPPAELPEAPALPSEPAEKELDLMEILGWVWLAGACAMALYGVVSYVRLKLKVRPSLQVEKRVFVCDGIGYPFLLGVLRPKVYLPSDLEEPHLSYVLAHEKAHVKRGDHLWKPLGFALLTLHWFNPLLWVAYLLLCRDIESACDEKVVRDMDNTQKDGYSRALLACSLQGAFHRRWISACPVAFGETGVKTRIKSVLHYKKPAFWVLLIAILACVAVGVFFLTDPTVEESEESSVESSEEVSQEISQEKSEDLGSLEFIPLDGFAYAVSIGTYKGEHVKIPVTYNGWDVTQIAENGFAGSDIKSVYIPNSITVIGESAFADCKQLVTVEFRKTRCRIEKRAFYGCSSLKKIELPAMTYLQAYTFAGCTSLEEVILPEELNQVRSDAFDGCVRLKSIQLPKAVTMIGTRAFRGCTSLQEITLGGKITTVSADAFAGCTDLKDIYCEAEFMPTWPLDWNRDCNATVHWVNGPFEAPEGSQGLAYRRRPYDGDLDYEYGMFVCAMGNCTDTHVKVPEWYSGMPVFGIDSDAFWGEYRFTAFDLPQNLRVIYGRAFENCTALSYIVIPEKVFFVGEDVFNGCTALEAVYCEAEAPGNGWSRNWLGDNCPAKVYWAGEWSYVDGVPTPN